MLEKMILHTLSNGDYNQTEVSFVPDIIYDIIVAGLGTTGAISAITAAQKGMKVFCIERNSGMGGIGVFGGIWSYFFGSPGGKFEEINDFAKKQYKKGYTMAEPQDGIGEVVYWWDPQGTSLGTDRFIPGALKEYALEYSAQKCGCILNFNSVVCGVFTKGNRVCGVRYIMDGKQYDVFAKVIIDALGDAFISELAGSPIIYGRNSDGVMMNFIKAYYRYEYGLLKGYYNATNAQKYLTCAQLSKELLKATENMSMLGNENQRIVFEATIPGIRETGHIKTLQPLTINEYTSCVISKEPLFFLAAPLDNTNTDIGFETPLHQDWAFICDMNGKFMLSCGVPLKMLFPVNKDGDVIEGLLTVGRGMGIDHDICGGFRMKKDYEKLGEAAATVVVQAINDNCLPHLVCYDAVKDELIKTGCLDYENYLGIASMLIKDGKYNKKVEILHNEDELITTLASEKPQLAYWSLKVLGDKAVSDKLIKKAQEKGEFQGHFCIGLAIAGFKEINNSLKRLLDKCLEEEKITFDEVRYFVLLARQLNVSCSQYIIPLCKKLLKAHFEIGSLNVSSLETLLSIVLTTYNMHFDDSLLKLNEIDEILQEYSHIETCNIFSSMLKKIKNS